MEKQVRLTKWIVPLVLTAVLLGSCVNQKKVRMLQERTVKGISQEFLNAQQTAYKVKAGDHLYIKIYSIDPKTSKFFQTDFPELMTGTYLYLNSYKVDAEGYIGFSFIDKLYVKGLTIEEVQAAIQKTLNEYFKECTAFVKLVNFQVSVLGEVASPGTYTIDREQINLLQALGLAGGATQFGRLDKVTLVRQTLNGSQVHYLDLRDNAVLQSELFYLMPNDIVYVEPRGSKSWVFTRFPYEMFFTIVSMGLAVYAIVK